MGVMFVEQEFCKIGIEAWKTRILENGHKRLENNNCGKRL
jgi:hypothetical protein